MIVQLRLASRHLNRRLISSQASHFSNGAIIQSAIQLMINSYLFSSRFHFRNFKDFRRASKFVSQLLLLLGLIPPHYS